MAEWALAIHGGAGTPARDDLPVEVRDAHVEALRAALAHGRDRLAAGAPALDVVSTLR